MEETHDDSVEPSHPESGSEEGQVQPDATMPAEEPRDAAEEQPAAAPSPAPEPSSAAPEASPPPPPSTEAPLTSEAPPSGESPPSAEAPPPSSAMETPPSATATLEAPPPPPPAVEQVPPKKKSKKWWFIGCGCLLVLCIAVVAAAALLGWGGMTFFQAIQAPVGPIKGQLDALNAGDVQKAYKDYTSNGFQGATSLEEFTKIVEDNPGIFKSKSSSFNNVKINNGIATVEGTVVGQDGTVTEMTYKCVEEGGAWKIQMFEKK